MAIYRAAFRGEDKTHHREQVFGDKIYRAAFRGEDKTVSTRSEAPSLIYRAAFRGEDKTIARCGTTSAPIYRAAFRGEDKTRSEGSRWVGSIYRELLQRGLELFHERRDKEWQLTDCISFVVMANESLSEALTADRHFDQAGFKALLK